MNRYEIIIFWSEEDQAFVADVPELAGCMAHGNTHESALAAVKDAIIVWIETARATGRVVPPTNGSAVIPAALREQLELKDGDQLIWSAREGELIATLRPAQLRKAQASFQKFVPTSAPSLADELIAERRAASETQ